MDAADVRLLKLGYFAFDPVRENYWAAVERTRAALAGWSELAAMQREVAFFRSLFDARATG